MTTSLIKGRASCPISRREKGPISRPIRPRGHQAQGASGPGGIGPCCWRAMWSRAACASFPTGQCQRQPRQRETILKMPECISFPELLFFPFFPYCSSIGLFVCCMIRNKDLPRNLKERDTFFIKGYNMDPFGASNSHCQKKTACDCPLNGENCLMVESFRFKNFRDLRYI